MTHEAGLLWADPAVQAIEAAVVRAWTRLSWEARNRIATHFKSVGGMKLSIVSGLCSKDGAAVNATTKPGGDFIHFDVEAATRNTPWNLERIFLHECAHCLGEQSEAGADALAASWGWPREVSS